MNHGGSSVEAPLNPMWSVKWITAFVVLLGMAGWFFYDAAVGYPQDNRRFEKFRELSEAGKEARWPEVAAEHGWSEARPGEDAKHSKRDIIMQWVYGGSCAALALIALGRWLWYRGTRLAVEPDGFVGPRGKRVPFEAIQSIDKAKWEPKGIAVAHYEQDGRAGKVKLDEWMYPEAERVLTELERRTGLGGPLAG